MLAGEGWPYLIVIAIVGIAVYRFWGPLWASPIAALVIYLYFLFRDPLRVVPPEPLGAVSPVDGVILDAGPYRAASLPGNWIRIAIRTQRMGAYTVRAPIEGAILDVAACVGETAREQPPSGMWLRSEEQHDVVLTFPGGYPLLRPKTFVRYGERIGQGQRFAYLRLAPRAEVFLPPASQLRIAVGDRVAAGETILADLPE